MADIENRRVQVFTADGSFTSSFSCSDKPYDVAVDNTGKIHIVLYSPNRVEVFSWDGGQPQSTYDAGGNLRSPYSITIDDSGYIFVGDYGKDCVRVIDPQGGLVSTSGTRIDAYGITLDTHGNVYVADNYNKCIHKYEAINKMWLQLIFLCLLWF